MSKFEEPDMPIDRLLRSLYKGNPRISFHLIYTHPRYKMLSKETWPKYSGDVKEATKIILKTVEPEKKPATEQVVFGKSKIFIKNPEWVC
jgi:hypothetical protein